MSSRMSNFEVQYAARHPYKCAGTFMTAAGTLIPGVAGKILKVHQYNISVLGSIAYSLNDAKPTGGTVDWGGYISSGLITNPANDNPRPFVQYPACLCKTTNLGSALCLGTYVTAPVLGTVYFQAVYTDSDAA